MSGIFSFFQKLGFTDGGEDEMNTGARHEQDEDEEEEDEEEEEEGRGLFGFSFNLPTFSFGRKRDDDEEEEDEEEEPEEEEPVRSAQGRAQGRPGKVIDLKKSKERKADASGEEKSGRHCEHIFVVRQLQDSRTIITHLHEGDSVVLNLENVDPKDCGRVIDLLSGAAFALGGSITKVSRLTYLLAPGSVRVIPPHSAPTSTNRFTL